MDACPACGKELPGEFPFCPFCGAPSTVQLASSLREERKVVTSLFCDLVGFTASSEKTDPEDVDRCGGTRVCRGRTGLGCSGTCRARSG